MRAGRGGCGRVGLNGAVAGGVAAGCQRRVTPRCRANDGGHVAGALAMFTAPTTTEETGTASGRQYAASHRAAFRRFSQSRHSTASMVSIATFVPSQFPQK